MYRQAYRDILRKNKRVNGEYYISSVVNEMADHHYCEVKSFRARKMYSLGTEDEITEFLGGQIR